VDDGKITPRPDLEQEGKLEPRRGVCRYHFVIRVPSPRWGHADGGAVAVSPVPFAPAGCCIVNHL
jgi:hypothetical protein